MRPPSASRTVAALWVLAMAWSSGTYAEIYKWVDQKGVTNYSGAPPATGKAQTLDPGATTVSVYQAPAPQNAARALDAIMRQRIAMLESQLQAERLARLAQHASHQTDADRIRLAYEQCLSERRVDCDTARDGMRATPYFYAAAAPVFVVGRPLTPFTTSIRLPFTRTIGVRFPQPAATRSRSSRKF